MNPTLPIHPESHHWYHNTPAKNDRCLYGRTAIILSIKLIPIIASVPKCLSDACCDKGDDRSTGEIERNTQKVSVLSLCAYSLMCKKTHLKGFFLKLLCLKITCIFI